MNLPAKVEKTFVTARKAALLTTITKALIMT